MYEFPVKHLINGVTVAQVPVDEVTYYHVELPRHSVLLAQGLPAESVPRYRRPVELCQWPQQDSGSTRSLHSPSPQRVPLLDLAGGP